MAQLSRGKARFLHCIGESALRKRADNQFHKCGITFKGHRRVPCKVVLPSPTIATSDLETSLPRGACTNMREVRTLGSTHLIKPRDFALTNWAYSHSWKRQTDLRASKVRTSCIFMHRNAQMKQKRTI